MSGRPRKHKLEATSAERAALEHISQNPGEHPRKRLGAQILLYALDGLTTAAIADRTGMSQSFVAGLVRRAPLLGLLETVMAMPLRRHPVRITADCADWVCFLAGKSPAELGIRAMPAWSMESLAGYIRDHCEEAGYPELRRIAKSTVWHILRSERQEHSLKADSVQDSSSKKSPAESGA